MTTKVSSTGSIVLPLEFRRRDRIKAGQRGKVERIQRGEYHLRLEGTVPNKGLIDWLLSCPHKGFFVPIGSGSTKGVGN